MCFTVVRHKSAILRSRKNYRGITAKKLIIEYLSVFVKIRVYSVVYFPCKHEVKTPPSDWPVTRFFVVYISNQEGRLDSRESQIYYHFYKHGMTAEKLQNILSLLWKRETQSLQLSIQPSSRVQCILLIVYFPCKHEATTPTGDLFCHTRFCCIYFKSI